MQEYSVLLSLSATIFRVLRENCRGPAKFGPGFAVIALVGLEALRRAGYGPLPLGPILDVVILHAAVTEGVLSALITSVITLGYEAFTLHDQEPAWHLSEGAVRVVWTHAVVALAIVGLTVVAKRQRH